MKRFLLLAFAALLGTSSPAGGHGARLRGDDVYIAVRGTGTIGAGRRSDPYNGSTPEQLSAILAKVSANAHLNFAPGVYSLRVTDVMDGLIKEGWKVKGAGKGRTVIQLTGSLAGIHFLSVLASPGGVFTSNVTVSDLTVDCNWPNLANSATTGQTVREFAGSATAGSPIFRGSGFTPTDVGELLVGPGISVNTWIGRFIDSNHAELSSSATANAPIAATASRSGSYRIASKRGVVSGISLGGSNNRIERVRVINSYGSYANGEECFALRIGGTDYSGVQRPGRNNWIVNCDAEQPWGTYANPFAASNTSASGVVQCRAAGINDGLDGRGWTSGGVNGAALKNFLVRDCQFADTYGVFYIDTGTVDGLEIRSNRTVRGKIGCAIVNPNLKRNIRIVHNRFELQNRGSQFPTAAIQFLNSPAATEVTIGGNAIMFLHDGRGVDLFRTLQAGSDSLGPRAWVIDNIGPQSLASMGDPRGFYRNNRDVNGRSWFGP